MTKEEFFKSKWFKILLPIVLVWSVTVIVRGGYETGQWLYRLMY
jgi:hypothetical protein